MKNKFSQIENKMSKDTIVTLGIVKMLIAFTILFTILMSILGSGLFNLKMVVLGIIGVLLAISSVKSFRRVSEIKKAANSTDAKNDEDMPNEQKSEMPKDMPKVVGYFPAKDDAADASSKTPSVSAVSALLCPYDL